MRLALRVALVLSIVGATASCVPERDLSILINETDAPIRVRYATPFFNVGAGSTPICQLFGEPPEVKPTGTDLRSRDGWTPPSGLDVDLDKCETSFVLEPGIASVLYRAGYCDDYKKHADQGAAFRPSLEYLVIEGRSGTREWRGWEAVAQFKRGWWSSWGCFMRVRD